METHHSRQEQDVVLVVEDDELSLKLLRNVLTHHGFIVYTCKNGKEALEFLENHKPPSMILLDSAMPVMNGAKFRQKQLQNPKLAQIPTVLVSAIDDYERRKGILASLEFLAKPIDFDQLLNTVQHYAHHNDVQSSSVS